MLNFMATISGNTLFRAPISRNHPAVTRRPAHTESSAMAMEIFL
ncbi:MAG: hypothetical protein PHH20_02240 [Candidatus Omnitrophica bacterium]|nr:hypothetical protein [Candidatus Omnitrophota bacterium]